MPDLHDEFGFSPALASGKIPTWLKKLLTGGPPPSPPTRRSGGIPIDDLRNLARQHGVKQAGKLRESFEPEVWEAIEAAKREIERPGGYSQKILKEDIPVDLVEAMGGGTPPPATEALGKGSATAPRRPRGQAQTVLTRPPPPPASGPGQLVRWDELPESIQKTWKREDWYGQSREQQAAALQMHRQAERLFPSTPVEQQTFEAGPSLLREIGQDFGAVGQSLAETLGQASPRGLGAGIRKLGKKIAYPAKELWGGLRGTPDAGAKARMADVVSKHRGRQGVSARGRAFVIDKRTGKYIVGVSNRRVRMDNMGDRIKQEILNNPEGFEFVKD